MRQHLVASLCALATVCAPLATAQSFFTSQQDYTTVPIQTYPWACELADLNHDGTSDLAYVCGGGTAFGVRLGNAIAGFGPLTYFPTGDSPQSLAFADVNADNHLDVVWGNYIGAGVNYRLGDGLGGFGPTQGTAVVSPTITDVSLGDLNLDGILDIAATHEASGTLGVLLGSAGYAFLTSSAFSAPGSPQNVRLADLDHDGKLDALTAHKALAARVHLNDGAGGFQPPASFSTPAPCFWVDAADVNGDSHLDLACTNESGAGAITIRLGDGAGGFGAGHDWSTATASYWVALRDVNLDNRLDIVALAEAGNVAVSRLGDGAGGFGPPLTSPLGSPFSGAFGDVNGDGRPDLAVAARFFHVIRVRLGNGDGTFTSDIADTLPHGVAAADFDEDGFADILSTNKSVNTVTLRLGTGAVAPGAAAAFGVNTAPYTVAAADFNGDGHVDFATGHEAGTLVSARFGTGAGGFHPLQTLTTQTSPQAVAVADFDKDGLTDLAFANRNSDSISVFLSSPSGFSTAVNTTGVGSSPSSIAAKDLNLDGFPDLCTANFLTPSGASVLVNSGNGTFPSSTSYLLSLNNAACIAAEDVDYDGAPELIVGAFFGFANQIAIFHNDGSGAFVSVAYISSPSLVDVRATDIDANGSADIVALRSSELSVFLNDGFGSYLTPALTALPAGSRVMALADLDSDGRLDCVTANSTANSLTYLKNATPYYSGTTSFGAGTPSCYGTLGIASWRAPKIDSPEFKIVSTQAPPNSAGLCLVGNAPADPGLDVFGVQFACHIDPFQSTEFFGLDARSDALGNALSPAPIPNSPQLVGSTYFAQSIWYSNECKKGIGFSSSKGLTLVIQP